MASTPQIDNKENLSEGNLAEVPCTKRARVEKPDQKECQSAPDMAPATIELTTKLASGNTLGVVSVQEHCTGPMLKLLLQTFVEEGKMIDALLIGSSTFGDNASETVKDYGLSTGSVIQVVLREAAPTAHLFKPCSAAQLSCRHGSWCIGGGSDDEESPEEGDSGDGRGYNLCRHGVQHKDMDTAPKVGREVAEEMQTIKQTIWLLETQEIVVISNPGRDAKIALLRALAIQEEHLRFDSEGYECGLRRQGEGFKVWEQAKVTRTNWSHDVIGRGLSRDPECREFVEEAFDLANVMANRLTHHFHFEFSAGCVDFLTSPKFDGGFASDGSIVGILTSDCSA